MNTVQLLAQIHDDLRAIQERLDKRTHQNLCLAVRFWSLMAGLMTMTLALVLLVGPSDRISSSAYWGLSTFGGSRSWGMAFFVAALTTLIAVWQAPRQLRWTLLLQAFPYAGMAVTFLASAIRFEDANLTATPIYGWISVLTLCLADQARRCAKEH